MCLDYRVQVVAQPCWPISKQHTLYIVSSSYCIQHGLYKGRPHIINIPLLNKVEAGYTGFTLPVCLSVCPSVDRTLSTLYFLQYSLDLFHIYASYQATSEGVSHMKFFQNWKIWSFGKLFKFVTSTLIMGAKGGGGYLQNAGVLVVLVENSWKTSLLWLCEGYWLCYIEIEIYYEHYHVLWWPHCNMGYVCYCCPAHISAAPQR